MKIKTTETFNIKILQSKLIFSLSNLTKVLFSNSLKSSALDGLENDHGTAEVKMMGDNQIEVHCFGEVLDTTFMLDYYEHNDSVMVCLTGSDFSNMYGHGLGEGHMSGGMMNMIQVMSTLEASIWMILPLHTLSG